MTVVTPYEAMFGVSAYVDYNIINTLFIIDSVLV